MTKLLKYLSRTHLVSDDRDLEDKQRSVATGLRRSFLRKEIVATAILFKEIFAITGPRNTYLQSTKMDLNKATVLAAGAKNQLQKLRDNPDKVNARHTVKLSGTVPAEAMVKRMNGGLILLIQYWIKLLPR